MNALGHIDIDVHMCVRTNPRRDWLAVAIQSVKQQGVNLHIVDGALPLHRKIERGFACGRASWVSWVDADDLVMPDTYNKIRAAILRTQGARGVYFTGEHWFGEKVPFKGQTAPFSLYRTITHHDIMTNPLAAHHVVVIRRDIVNRAIELLKPLPESATAWAITAVSALIGGFERLLIDGYGWRIHKGQTSWGFTLGGINDAARKIQKARREMDWRQRTAIGLVPRELAQQND